MGYLRNTKDGTIYEYDEILANHPLCEVITEEEAFPERYFPDSQINRESGLDLSTAVEEEVVAPPEETALSKEAGTNFFGRAK